MLMIKKHISEMFFQTSYPRQSGSSLVEVLVTIIVLSLGLLSISGLIVTGMKYGHNSYGSSQASWIANDIVDRMRANRDAASTPPFSYNLAMTAPAPSSSSSNVAQNDLANWRAKLTATLPSGKGSINVDSATLKVVVVVQWVNHTNAVPNTQNFTVETFL